MDKSINMRGKLVSVSLDRGEKCEVILCTEEAGERHRLHIPDVQWLNFFNLNYAGEAVVCVERVVFFGNFIKIFLNTRESWTLMVEDIRKITYKLG